MNKNKITYLLGAGASYQACPILSELGEKMIELAKYYLGSNYKEDYNIKRDQTRNHSQNILQIIGYFGRKSIEFGTIDTYAKKLSLNSDYDFELQSLKLAVSVFFTLWEMSDDPIKNRLSGTKIYPYKNIDQRYISLLATFLEKSKNGMPVLNDLVKFVSWNYDLQLEKTYMSFVAENLNLDWRHLDEYFAFKTRMPFKDEEIDVCHLNGYAGHYYLNERGKGKEYEEVAFLGRTDSNHIEEIIEKIEYLYESIGHNGIRLDDHINYAWEQTEIAKQKREYAKKVFKEADVVVIIGYSFPPFNRKVDQMMFDELKGRKTKVYYQDPNASESMIKNYVDDDCEVVIIKDRSDQFFVPYEF